MFHSLGPMEILTIATLGFLFFGTDYPSLGRSLGRCVQEFRSAVLGTKE